MSDEINQTSTEPTTEVEIVSGEEATENKMVLEEEIFVDSQKKFTFRSFLKMSGITITFLITAAVLMIVGLIVFYFTAAEPTKNVGFWLIIAGVIGFLLTTIFGFERID